MHQKPFNGLAPRRSSDALSRAILVSTVLAVSACGGSGSGDAAPVSPTPTPARGAAASPSSTPAPSPAAPSPSPTAGTVCGSGFLGNATASFSSVACVYCRIPDQSTARRAIDNDAGTAAEANFSGGGSGDITLKASTQAGTVIAAGRLAGVLIQYPAGVIASESLAISTFLDGVKQESGGGFTNRMSPTTASTPQFHRFRTTKAYDRIDVTVSRTGDATTAPVRIIEVCSE